MTTAPPILIVDDKDEDIAIFEDLFAKARVPNPVELFRSGEAVIKYLTDWCERAPRECGRSALMLLDVRMPRMSGFDVLAWVRRHPLLTGLVVVMISAFEDAGDAERAVQMGAHSYLLKFPLPMTLAALAKLAREQP